MAREDGKGVARQGFVLMGQRRYDEAYPYLLRGSELLLKELHGMPESLVKDLLEHQISTLLSKAEECKRAINSSIPNPAEFRHVSAKVLVSFGQIAPKTPGELRNMIEQELLMVSPGVKWDDIAGLAKAKIALHDGIILPMKHPDMFTGLRSPSKGILLFGPPGTGKTILVKAVATESSATFFNVRCSALASKFVFSI